MMIDKLGRFSVIFYKGDNFCDILFAFLHIRLFLKRGLLITLWSKLFPFRADPFSEGCQNSFDGTTSPENVYIHSPRLRCFVACTS